MADWKTRKYVPDSDDEEEESTISSQSTPHRMNEPQDYPCEITACEQNSCVLECDGAHPVSRQEKLPDNGEIENQDGDVEDGSMPFKIVACSDKSQQKPQIQGILNPLVAPELDDPNDLDELQICESKIATQSQVSRKTNTERLAGRHVTYDIDEIDELQEDTSLPSIPKLFPLHHADQSRKHHPEKTIGPQQFTSDHVSQPGSGDTSPLSSVPSTPPTISSSNKGSLTVTGNASRHITSTSPISKPSGRLDGVGVRPLEYGNTEIPVTRSLPSLRPRKPVQLRPYRHENDKYRRDWLSHGLCPLRIEQSETAKQSNDKGEQPDGLSAEEDTHYTNARENSKAADPSSPIEPASLPASPSTIPLATRAHQANPQTNDRDFPDADSFLRHVSSDTVIKGFKRRKTDHIFTKKKRVYEKLKLPRIAVVIQKPSREPFTKSPVSNSSPARPGSLSPSPPLLTDATLVGSVRNPSDVSPPRDGFRFPPGMMPLPAESPSFIHSPNLTPAAEFNDESDSEISISELTNKSRTTRIIDSPSESSSENESDQQIQRVRRKIRGVLPASWLRLDLKERNKPLPAVTPDFPSRSVSPDVTPPLGIARPISRPLRRIPVTAHSSNTTIEISDDSSPGRSRPLEQRSGLHPRRQRDRMSVDPIGDLDDIDTMEDNRIDQMLPTKKRLPKRKRKIRGDTKKSGVKEKKPKMMEDWISTRNNSDSHPRQLQMSKRARHKKTAQRYLREPRPPRLSILDIINSYSSKDVPMFVRVAARISRSRIDKGAHSPSRKLFHLATQEDTADVHKALHEWKEGSFTSQHHVRPSTSTSERSPLRERTTNVQWWASQPDSSKESLRKESSFPHKLTARRGRNARGSKSIRHSYPEQDLGRYSLQTNDQQDDTVRGQRSQMISKKPQRTISSFLQKCQQLRPAVLLESVRNDLENIPRKTSAHRFHRNMSSFPDSNIILERYLRSTRSHPDQRTRKDGEAAATTSISKMDSAKARPLKKSRKRLPKFINVNDSGHKQHHHEHDAGLDLTNAFDEDPSNIHVLRGLRDFGAHYTVDFGLLPLPVGLSLTPQSFIGSGIFSRGLDMASRDLDQTQPLRHLRYLDMEFDWGPWNECVSSQVGVLFDCISRNLLQTCRQDTPSHSNDAAESGVHALQSVVCYFTENAHFIDPVDRNSMLSRLYDILATLMSDLDELWLGRNDQGRVLETEEQHRKLCARLSTRVLMLVYQLRQVACHDLVISAHRSQLQSLFSSSMRQTAMFALSGKIDDVREYLRALKDISRCNQGISEHQYKIESILVIYHIIKREPGSIEAFWEAINAGSELESTFNAGMLDQQWARLFTILPLLEFNAQGVIVEDQRHKESCDDWSTVRRLTKPVLDSYTAAPQAQNPTFVAYCRAVIGRSLQLIRVWGWNRCEIMFGAHFDFFASNNLAHLRNEQSYGSASFLENLADNPSLDIRKRDPCFHVFLKVLGSGLQAMRKIYTDKKIRSVVWRLMPNHDRRHPKDQPAHQDDLDALRNHHDLLSTLYWASPAAARPGLNAIRNVVRLADSHREACCISIRAWSNLVNFQLSTNEPLTHLQPFSEWCNDLLEQIIHQHRSARTEIDSQLHLLDGNRLSRDVVESTISKNQRQVEAILSDTLVSLQRAMCMARSLEAAKMLLTSSLSLVFDLLDTTRSRINGVIIQGLDIVAHFTARSELPTTTVDSQGFEDWLEFDNPVGLSLEGSLPPESIHHSIHRLLSNCFGAEVAPDDTLLVKVVATWTSMARISVKSGHKTWNDFVGRYGSDCWSALGDTEQTRKFTPYFLATLILVDPGVYSEHRELIWKWWLASLVERESLLKFQHLLTTALLNTDPGNPLLANLPFWANAATGKFDITLTAFCQRRSSLMSCITSNMRESIEFCVYHDLADHKVRKLEYIELLKHLMATMKHNYQELGSQLSVKGAYVDFVQAVVESLQQHTASLCPIDRFFTDSAAFPLPTQDPMYVAGQLRNYSLQLRDSGTAMKLLVFIQTIVERAVSDAQPQDVVEQLHRAMTRGFAAQEAANLSLRSFLVQAIFPAYIEVALSTACGWLLAIPILRTLQQNLPEILRDLDGTNRQSIEAVENTIITLFCHVQRSLHLSVDDSRILQQPSGLKVLALYFAVIATALPTLDYIARLREQSPLTVDAIRYFTGFSQFAQAAVLGQEHIPAPSIARPRDMPMSDRLESTRRHATQELRETLQKNWRYHNNGYHVIRGNKPNPVAIDLGSLDEERGNLLEQIGGFERVLRGMPALGDDEDWDGVNRRVDDGKYLFF